MSYKTDELTASPNAKQITAILKTSQQRLQLLFHSSHGCQVCFTCLPYCGGHLELGWHQKLTRCRCTFNNWIVLLKPFILLKDKHPGVDQMKGV